MVTIGCRCNDIYRVDLPGGDKKEFTGSAAQREAQRYAATKGGTVVKVR